MSLPPYNKFPVLISEDLILRKFEAKDIPQLLPISYYDGIKAETEAEAAEMLQKINRDYLKGESIHWGIEDRTLGEIIGTCGYYRGFKNKTGELGCILLPQFYGFGLMTRAMRLAIDFGFKTIVLKRITAITSEENFSAQKLLHRLNFGLVLEEENMLHYELFAEKA
jgi:[ribosomal protein S5]-alanine N-acetyltransferase